MTAGSSPRGRGTRLGFSPPIDEARFIPARAGNAHASGRQRGARTVHPRAGGERPAGLQPEGAQPGSSPRGRGTHSGGRYRRRFRRFIPARAGNAHRTPYEPLPTAVHPRAGGERGADSGENARDYGSSPRGRGTRGGPVDSELDIRFIPARAGNARERRNRKTATAVHPRAGGERVHSVANGNESAGSSPRGRGTRRRQRRVAATRRFIPARAGNAVAGSSNARSQSVHPRAGGERDEAGADLVARDGSSPRGRGTLARHLERQHEARFIPARAGNANRTPDHTG